MNLIDPPSTSGAVDFAECKADLGYFVRTYCQIESMQHGGWIPFDLWPEQERALEALEANPLAVILKARQLGMTWLCLAFALWLILFHAPARILLFSLRDDEARVLLERLHGMYKHLPDSLKERETKKNEHVWTLATGSEARAFPTSAGDSYEATLAFVDEADKVPNLSRLMGSVKPTIDAGGRMILLSRTDKEKPISLFKKIYRSAKASANEWFPFFLPWHARPDRTPEWYAAQHKDILANTGALDGLHEQYPATDAEALAPATLSKRIPYEWVIACYEGRKPIEVKELADIAGLVVWKRPEAGCEYVCGADPAEGLPGSDDSAAVWCEKETGEEVATLCGKIPPDLFGSDIGKVSAFFNGAPCLPERNNHGHALILALRAALVSVLHGLDSRPGWLSHTKGKADMYTTLAENIREGDCAVYSFETQAQIASVDRATLRAPSGQLDDRADAYALAQQARITTESRPQGHSKPLPRKAAHVLQNRFSSRTR